MIDKLLVKLQRVKKVGNGKWIASCPTREDKSPSLSIRLLDDGRILLHDFGNSSVPEILDALGMDLSDLFPPKPESHAVKGGRHFDPYQALKSLAEDALVILIAARMVIRKEPLPESDMVRLNDAVGRFQDARSFVLGGRL